MNRLTQALIFCLQLTCLNPAHADYLVQSPGLSRVDYQALLLQHPSLKALSEIGSPVSAHLEQRQELMQQLEKAQRAFLSESIESANVEFQKIIAMALDYDWDEASRAGITYAFFRMSQLSKSETESQQLIRRGLNFRREGSVGQDIFPPPFLNLIKEERSRLEQEAILWDPSVAFRGYSKVLINGTPYPIKEGMKLRIWPGTYRVTALSDMHLPFSQVIKSEDIGDMRLNRAALAQGDCDHPQLSHGTKRNDLVLAYRTDCIQSFRNGKWAHFLGHPEALDLGLPLVKEAPNLLHTSQAPQPERKWYQNKWVWIGAALVATSVTLMMAQNNKGGGDAANGSPPALTPTHKGPLPP